LTGPALLLAICALPAQAHLLVAQHGTLNLVDNAVFMAMSIPISAFAGIDANGDGDVTMIEFNRHREAVVASVQESVSLTDGEGRLGLQGVLLSPVTPHDGPTGSLTDVTVLGRFDLRNASTALRFENRLYAQEESRQSMKISATRPSDGYRTEFVLTPANPARMFFLNTSQGYSSEQAAMVQREQ
jgi:hypothetical protein